MRREQLSANPIREGKGHEAPPSGSLHPRLAWMLVYNETQSVSAVCEKFDISRKTFYKWLKRYQASGGDSSSLVNHSRRPHRFPRATSPETIEILRKAKELTGFGQRRLRTYIKENFNITLSERTIWKLLKRSKAGSARADKSSDGSH